MMATFYDARSTVAAELDALMASNRFGEWLSPTDYPVYDPVIDDDVWENRFLNGLREHARTQLADQGDGNHFAFLGEMEVTPELIEQLRTERYTELADSLAAGPRNLRVLVTHHGSRGLGAHVFKRGQIAAEKHVARVAEAIPEAAAWLDFDSDAGRDYWDALQYVGRWTRANHRAIHRRFLERIGASSIAEAGNAHNFVWKRGDTFYHGKGATPAWKDEQGRSLLGLIPLNMAEPILLVLGSDNSEFLSFAPHGAGRNLSRTAGKPDKISSIETTAHETRASI
jgi:RNA-splicing ligase RtcB